MLILRAIHADYQLNYEVLRSYGSFSEKVTHLCWGRAKMLIISEGIYFRAEEVIRDQFHKASHAPYLNLR